MRLLCIHIFFEVYSLRGSDFPVAMNTLSIQILNSKFSPIKVIRTLCWLNRGFPGGTSGKESTSNSGDRRDTGSVPGSGREHGNPLQYSCLENPMNRGVWQATVNRVVLNLTWLKWLSAHTQTHTHTHTYMINYLCQKYQILGQTSV